MAKKLNAGQMAHKLAELGGGAIKKGGGGMVKGAEVFAKAFFDAGEQSMFHKMVNAIGSGIRKAIGSGK